MTTPETLAAALVAFQADMPKVGKDKTANVGTYSYTYADLASLTDKATPILVKHGLSFTAQPRRYADGRYELVGVLRHTSGESDEGALPLFGQKAQELGSSITYCRRYLFGCMTGIVTEDDDDGARAQHAQGQTRRQEPPPDPMIAAKQAVKDAWEAKHGGTFDPEAMRNDYEQQTALPLDDASPTDLYGYANTLIGNLP